MSLIRFLRMALLATAVVASLTPKPAAAQQPTGGDVPSNLELLRRLDDTIGRLEEAEEELRYLRTRDQQLDAWQESVVRRLPDVSDSPFTPTSFGHVGQQDSCDACFADDGCGCEQPPSCPGLPDYCNCCLESLAWNKGPLRIVPFGYIGADMIVSEKAYTLLGAPLFLLPGAGAGVPDSRATFSAQQTTLGFNISGPDLGRFRSSAIVAFNFFGDRPVQNNPGVFFLLGFAQLQNDAWRFWVGQDGDAIGRQNTNSPSWATHKQSGNFGQIRPGFRMERFFRHSDTVQTSIYAGLTQQVVLDFIADPTVAGTDNGWPNVEFRWELGLGQDCGEGRPVMFALGGLIGETRAVDFSGLAVANVSTSWAVIPEMRLQLGRWGFQGEAFVGDAIGTYNAGVGQSLNAVNDEAIYTIGGFGEIFYNVSSCLTLGVGYGLDNPRDTDLAADQRARNETYWANAIWHINEQWESRFEIAQMETEYVAPSLDSKAMQYLVSLRYNF